MENKKVLAVVGATGAVGMEVRKLLEQNKIMKNIELRLFASKNSAGKKILFKNTHIVIEELKPDSFKGIDIALFCVESDISMEYSKYAVERGCIVVDNSSAFRMDKNTPLVIPEINSDEIKNHKGIISNPNCTTIITLMSIYPIHKLSRINTIHMASYQAVSGAGIKAMNELEDQIKAYVQGKSLPPKEFKHQILMNVFSHDSQILDSGYNMEEQKAILETKKILKDESIRVSPTCVRVPVLRSHSVAISVITDQRLELEQIRRAILNSDGTTLIDDRKNNHFPMPVESSNKHDVMVGRIRRGLSHENEIMLFSSGDQLLKGAALNAVQIAEKLYHE